MTRNWIRAAALSCLALPALAQTDTDPDKEFEALTLSVLQGISGKKIETSIPLQKLIEQALAEGQSDAYLEAILAEAAQSGEIEVPEAMVTTEGTVDTRTLLAALVAQSSVSGTDDPVAAQIVPEAPAAEANPAAGSTAQDAPAPQPGEPVYHVVVQGDSLAAISELYYDSAFQYQRIFEANRDILTSPNAINVGQRLLIP